MSGTLGGRRFNVSLTKVKLARAGGAGEWPSRPVELPLPGLVASRQPAALSHSQPVAAARSAAQRY